MKRLVISLVAIVSLLSVAVGIKQVYSLYSPPVAPVASTQTVQPEQKPPTVDELLRLVNAERVKVGVAPLVIDERLNQSAQYKAQDMIDRNYYAHKDPDTGLNNGLAYAKTIGAPCQIWISENIVMNSHSSLFAVSEWKNSPPHYKAMIDPRYESTGFGIAGDKVVEHFCDER